MGTRLGNPDLYTIGWIAALHIERAAAVTALDERHEEPEGFEQNQSDANSYTWGRMGPHLVVIASLPSGVYGTTPAATTASNLLSSFPWIRFGLLVGIGGGVSRPPNQDIRLGDVVVSQPQGTTGGVIQYDRGDARSDKPWQLKGHLNMPPLVLLHAVAALKAEHEVSEPKLMNILQAMWTANPRMTRKTYKNHGYCHQGSEHDRLFKRTHDHIEGDLCDKCDSSWEVERSRRDTTNPEIHYGIIASGNLLVKDAKVRDSIDEMVGDGCLCVEMEAAGLMNSFPCLVIRGICDYADSHKNDRWQRYASATAAAYAKELLGFVPAKQLETTPRALDALQAIEQSVKDIESTTLSISQEVQGVRTIALHTEQNVLFDRLPFATGASYDSQVEDGQAKCLPNTRVDLLRQVTQWAEDPQAKPIFWLKGMAGTGKSTICRSVAETFANTGSLGASFFFRRGEGDRGNLSRFFTTIAAQLARRKPATFPHIKEALDADSTVVDKGLHEQFEKLILRPLSATVPNSRDAQTITILIDALDECEGQSKLIIKLLVRAKDLGLKLFVTSRPDLPIRIGFQPLQGNYQDIALHEIPDHVIEHDISTFVGHELSTIRENYNRSVPEYRQLPAGWPGEAKCQALVAMAVPLFIFATTVCRFLAQRQLGNPNDNLMNVLEFDTRSQESKLDGTYLPVLNRLVSELSTSEKNRFYERFRKIVGSIVVLASPLPAFALASILCIPQHTIDDQLDLLHSVLSVPLSPEDPVRLLHLSFRDFLLDSSKREIHEFWVDEGRTHAQLARNCQRIMKEFLQKDICDIRWPGKRRQEIRPHTIECRILPETRYACLYWTYHLEKSEGSIDGNDVYVFLRQHFLNWIEALSLLGRTWEILKTIRVLQARVGTQSNVQLRHFLDDAIPWVRDNLSIIDSTPLQIYASALIFAPSSSIIRNTFLHEIPEWISLLPKVEKHWQQYLQKLQDHKGEGTCLTFSHDSTLIASGSEEGAVLMWQIDTGECLLELNSTGSRVDSVAFSHDLQLISCVEHNSAVCVWRVDTGESVWKAEGHRHYDTDFRLEGEGNALAFSHDSTLIVSTVKDRDEVATIRSTDTGRSIAKLQGPSNIIGGLVAFSPDSTSIVTALSQEGIILIHRADTGECTQRIQFPFSFMGMAFSPDLKLFACSCQSKPGLEDPGMVVGSIDTGEVLQQLDDESYTYFADSLVFSHNSRLVISGSPYETVKIWCVDTGACLQDFRSYGTSKSVAISPDTALVASVDHNVKIWPYSINIPHNDSHESEGDGSEIINMVYSPDSTLIASLSSDDEILLWRADTGKFICALDGPAELAHNSVQLQSLVFSPDSVFIASTWSYFSPKDGGMLLIFRTDTGACTHALEGNAGLAFSSDSTLVAASLPLTRNVRIWNIDTGRCVQELEWSRRDVNFIALSRDSTLLAGADGCYVRVWLIGTGECLWNLETVHALRPPTTHLTFSPDSALLCLLVGTSVDIWSLNTGQILRVLENCVEHPLWMFGKFVFSEDTKLLVDNQVFDITHDATAASEEAVTVQEVPILGLGVSDDDTWITWGKDYLLWLPSDYRGLSAEVSEMSVTLRSPSWGLSIIGFSLEHIPNLREHARPRFEEGSSLF